VSNFLTAAISATSDAAEDGSSNDDEQKKIFENFIAQFVVQVSDKFDKRSV
jgi:hypothetical protein